MTPPHAAPATPRPVLARHFGRPLPLGWTPAPASSDRAAWDVVPPVTRERIVRAAARHLDEPWTALPASLFARFRQDGDRTAYERPYFARRDRLAWDVLAAAVTEPASAETEPTWRERLFADIVDGLWLLCEESTWCLPAHDPRTYTEDRPLNDPERPQIDLFAAETAALLVLTDGILADDLDAYDPILRRRVHQQVRERVLRPYLERTDLGWYDGSTVPANNWNPWIHSNLLLAALRCAESDDALDTVVRRVLRGLDHFLTGQPADGGCDEGLRYWWRAAGSLFECLETLAAATGDDEGVFGHPLLRAMARYPLVASLGNGWVVNFADGPARGGGGACGLLHRFGRRVGAPDVIAHARALRGDGDPAVPAYEGIVLRRVLDDLLDTEWVQAPPAAFALPAQTWLPDTEMLIARHRQGTTDGLLLAAKGGHNDESHNHNDVGSFIVGLDGRPLVVDAGVGTYRRETFDPTDRYGIWTMRSGYHNVPLVNGVEQAAGSHHRSRAVEYMSGEDTVTLGLDLAGAYPDVAALHTWRRTFRLDRAAGRISVHDAWQTTAPPGALALHLLLSGDLTLMNSGRAVIVGDDARLELVWQGTEFDAHIEPVVIDDPLLEQVWGPLLHRLVLSARRPASTAEHTLAFRRAA
ncbi:Heparinase II/III-like protein [Actinacidiphila alni]|uniref:Heparinase II/III-like protein n=1 Tax=Actinacidiphila alni TaxID=380248 RepID=A0A1I2LAX5_9ACTN|nr:heparinase II/III family protein [Actinacidiphila alni]SFF75698.1 Heparinase II/III-like protein [Actinacidiphila alni]